MRIWIALIYGVPILTLFVRLMPMSYSYRRLYPINRALGHFEYLVGPWRDRLLLPIFGILAAYDFLYGLFTSYGFWTLFGVLALRWGENRRLRQLEFARLDPRVHPRHFFDHWYSLLGPWPECADVGETLTVSPAGAFFAKASRDDRALLPHSRIAANLWDTAMLAHLSLFAYHRLGAVYAREIFDVMASMWGKRVLERLGIQFAVEGVEAFGGLSGKTIVVANHLSYLDFVLGFFALSEARFQNGRPVRLRFVVAKDHFKDNPFFYRILGIGKLIEVVGMIFVDRKTKGRGYENLSAAAKEFSTRDVEMVIYPQGTRAKALPDGKAMRDGAYYTSFSPKKALEPLGHLKKGVATFARELARELMNTGIPVHIVPVGILGTGAIGAPGRFRAFSSGRVKFRVGTPLSFTAEEILNKTDFELLSAIDNRLLETLHYREKLEAVFLAKAKAINLGFDTAALETAKATFSPEVLTVFYPLIDRLQAADHLPDNARYWELLIRALEERPPLEKWQKLLLAVSDRCQMLVT